MRRYVLSFLILAFIYFSDTIFPSLKVKVTIFKIYQFLQKSAKVTGNIYGICAPIDHLDDLNTKIH